MGTGCAWICLRDGPWGLFGGILASDAAGAMAAAISIELVQQGRIY